MLFMLSARQGFESTVFPFKKGGIHLALRMNAGEEFNAVKRWYLVS